MPVPSLNSPILTIIQLPITKLPSMPPVSLYLHIPFCTHRCAYCDFNTYAGQEIMIPAYVDALIQEINFVGKQLRDYETTRPPDYSTIDTIFFGGGTPSLLSPLQFDSIFKSIRADFNVASDAEISIEANPGTVEEDALRRLREIGINRISFGVQSANTEELRMLERTHNFFTVIQAVASARKAGFDNLNLDLIYGLPEQTLQTWQTTVRRVLDLHPEHISAYALTLEHGTPFGRWASKGLLPLPNPDLAAEMYEWACETFEANGYVQYEISNWAKDVKGQRSNVEPANFDLQPLTPTFACRHNLQYWRSLPYLAFGAGAHGYANGYRYSNALRIKTYIERLTNSPILQSPQSAVVSIRHSQRTLVSTRPPHESNSLVSSLGFPLTPATVNQHRQSITDDMSEFMMTGLRLTQEGISTAEFESRFGRRIEDVYGKEIEELLKLGLLEQNDAQIRITPRARLLANQVFLRFV